MQIFDKPIGELTPYEKNPRKNKAAVAKVAESISEFGFKVPMVITPAGEVVAGHTRLLAAKEIGLTTVPCVIADDLTEEQIKAFRLADNKTAEFAEWDMDLLLEEMQDIGDIGMELFGFDTSVFAEEGGQRKRTGLKNGRDTTTTASMKRTKNTRNSSKNSRSRKRPTTATRRTRYTTPSRDGLRLNTA